MAIKHSFQNLHQLSTNCFLESLLNHVQVISAQSNGLILLTLSDMQPRQKKQLFSSKTEAEESLFHQIAAFLNQRTENMSFLYLTKMINGSSSDSLMLLNCILRTSNYQRPYVLKVEGDSYCSLPSERMRVMHKYDEVGDEKFIFNFISVRSEKTLSWTTADKRS